MGSIFTDARFASLLLVVITALIVGTIFYNQVEDMRLIDAFYFSAMTITTVGYGDFVPTTDAGKMFAVAYSFIGIGMILSLFKIVADHVLIFGNIKNVLDSLHKKGNYYEIRHRMTNTETHYIGRYPSEEIIFVPIRIVNKST